MGRLFWKIFFAFVLAQTLSGVALFTGLSIWGEHWRHGPPPGPDDRSFEAWLESIGEADPKTRAAEIAEASRAAESAPPWPGGSAGAPPPPGPGFPDGPPPGPPPPPYLPALAILIGCLVGSAALAWYFAKPVHRLRRALQGVAAGRLDTRVLPDDLGWRDEISDLGQDFDRMARELQRLVESQRQLLHDVSHELRSPLARLQAAIGLARQDPSRVELTFDRIERESARLATLVGEILTLARLESGSGDAQKGPVDLEELVATVAEDAQFEARSIGKDLRLESGSRARVMGRSEQLHRALENILRNAVKFTAPNTCVEVSLEAAEAQAKVLVRDHGPGVPTSQLEVIFQPFVRSSQSREEDGFGLGLAIAQRAIQANDGSIALSLPEGGGLCVEILLPLA